MDWLTNLMNNIPAWVITCVSTATTFICAIGLPSIVACCRTYSKASVYLYNAKKLTNHQNELVAKHNQQNELMVSFIKTQIATLTLLCQQEHNVNKKQTIEKQIEVNKEYLTQLDNLKVDGVEMATKQEIRQMKKVKIVKEK